MDINSRNISSGPVLSWAVCVILGALAANAETRIVLVGPLNVGAPTFFTEDIGWAPGPGNALSRTVDGGQTWQRIDITLGGDEVDAEIRGIYPSSAVEARVKLAALHDRLGLSPAMVVTYDGGLTWKAESLPDLENFFQGLSDESLYADPSGAVWIGGQSSEAIDSSGLALECPARGKDNTWVPTLLFRASPGSAWRKQALPIRNGCAISRVHFWDHLNGIAIAGRAIAYTRDGGNHWQQSSVSSSAGKGLTMNLPSLPESVQIRPDREGWIGCDYGQILHTVDGGEHWQEVAGENAIWPSAVGFGSLGAVYFTSDDVGFTLGDTGVFETRDRGKTWHAIATPESVQYLTCTKNQCWVMYIGRDQGSSRLYRIETQ